jgi:hypothetical protein
MVNFSPSSYRAETPMQDVGLGGYDAPRIAA